MIKNKVKICSEEETIMRTMRISNKSNSKRRDKVVLIARTQEYWWKKMKRVDKKITQAGENHMKMDKNRTTDEKECYKYKRVNI